MKYIFILIIVFNCVFNTFTQNINKYGDSIFLTIDENVLGNIQWQSSTDSLIWNDIEGATSNKLLYLITEDIYIRAKQIQDACISYSESKHIRFDESKKVYGVRIDRKNVTENILERVFNSRNKVTFTEVSGISNFVKDDFDSVYPYSKMRLCNLKLNKSNIAEITYINEYGFSRNEDTFVEIPIFYMNRIIEGNNEYRLISETQYEGFYPAPMFIEGDSILSKIYIAVYETSLDESDNARSVTGKLPLTELTLKQFRSLYLKKGLGFSGLDIRTIMSLQHLYLVRFANKNSQEQIGGGFSDLRQPIIQILNNGPSNEIVIQESAKFADMYWFVGQSTCILKNDQWTVSDYAKILEIKKNTPHIGKTTFLIDKVLTFDNTMFYGSSSQYTGGSDIINHDTGSTQNKTTNMNSETTAVKLFGIENLWGNVWEMIEGIFFYRLKPYISFNSQENVLESSYQPVDYMCVEQNLSNPWNGTFGFIGNLGYDNKYTWFSMPNEFGSNGVNGINGYGDFYYQYNDAVQKIYSVFGGGFDHFDRAGLFNIRNTIYSSNKWYLYGSRMQYKLTK